MIVPDIHLFQGSIICTDKSIRKQANTVITNTAGDKIQILQTSASRLDTSKVACGILIVKDAVVVLHIIIIEQQRRLDQPRQ